MNNLVDKDVQSMLLPLNVMQNIMFCPKYRIKNDVIGPIGIIYSLVSLIGTGFFIFGFFHRLSILYDDNVTRDNTTHVHNTKYLIAFFDCGYYSFGLAMNFISGVIETKTYISLVLVFQNVHRFLNDTKISKHFTFWSWISIIMAGGFFTALFISISIKLRLPYYYILSCYSMVSFDFNYMYAIRFLKLLEDKIILWNTRALNSQGRRIVDTEEVKRLFDAYVNILECYGFYKVCFRKIVSTESLFLGFFLYRVSGTW